MNPGRNPGRTVRIDVLPQGLYRLADCDAIVVIDVVLSGTVVATAIDQGRKTYVHGSLEEASRLDSRHLRNALRGQDGFEDVAGYEAIGPVRLGVGNEAREPLVLLAPWAAQIGESDSKAAIYVGSLRNIGATARMLGENHARVGLLGAGFRGESRSEDRIAAARLADALVGLGFRTDGMSTLREVESWADADLSLVSWGKSCDYLRRQGRAEDVDFVVRHQDDVNLVCSYSADGEVRGVVPGNLRAEGPVVVPYVPRAAASPAPATVAEEADLGHRRARSVDPRGA
jgi:phosphosulfolactate phosphohydrolase-like enzyme